MSERLDLYVERILSRIVIDDAQRREIEREIREHIRLAVAEAKSHGVYPSLLISGKREYWQIWSRCLDARRRQYKAIS